MTLAKRIAVVIAAPVLLAGIMLAGSAGLTKASAPKLMLPYTVHFNARATYKVLSNSFEFQTFSCSVSGAMGATETCSLAGSGSGHVTVPSKFKATLSLTGASVDHVTMYLSGGTSTCLLGPANATTSMGMRFDKARVVLDSTVTSGRTVYMRGTIKIAEDVAACLG